MRGSLKIVMIIFGVVLLIIEWIHPGFAEENTVVVFSRLWSHPKEQEFVINEIFKPFEAEHNCKIVFKMIGDDDLFLEVQKHQEMNAVTNARFRLTAFSFQGLKDEGVSETVLEKLKILEDKGFTLKDDFLEAVATQIGSEATVKYQEYLVNHAATPDVIIAYCSLMRDWIEAGYVIDLTAYLNSWTDRTFPKGFAHMTGLNGRQYFLPIGADVYLLIANQRALKYLPEAVNLQDITWEQVVTWSVKMATEEDVGKFALAAYPQSALIYHYGGVILSYGGGFPTINSVGAIQAWELLVKMKNAYLPEVLSYNTVIEPMISGEAWLTVAHCAHVGNIYKSNPAQFVVAPAPKGPAGIGSVAGTSGFAVVKGAPHQELALKFVEYMTRPEKQLKIAKGAGGFIPPVEEAIQLLSDESLEDEIIQKALYVMDQGVLAFVPSTFGAAWPSVKALYDDAFKKLVLEDGAVDQTYLDDVQEQIDALEVEGLLLKSTTTRRNQK